MSEPIHCLVVSPRAAANGASARGAGLLRDAHTLGLARVSAIECHDLYFVEGALSAAERHRLAAELLSDPITQTAAWRENNGAHLTPARLRWKSRCGRASPIRWLNKSPARLMCWAWPA